MGRRQPACGSGREGFSRSIEDFAHEVLYGVKRGETHLRFLSVKRHALTARGAATPEQPQANCGCSDGGVKPAGREQSPGPQICSKAKRSETLSFPACIHPRNRDGSGDVFFKGLFSVCG